MEGTAINDRTAERAGELSYRKGEVVLILDSSHTQWWIVEKIEGWKTEDGRGTFLQYCCSFGCLIIFVILSF
jgi:hypothetical protein